MFDIGIMKVSQKNGVVSFSKVIGSNVCIVVIILILFVIIGCALGIICVLRYYENSLKKDAEECSINSCKSDSSVASTEITVDDIRMSAEYEFVRVLVNFFKIKSKQEMKNLLKKNNVKLYGMPISDEVLDELFYPSPVKIHTEDMVRKHITKKIGKVNYNRKFDKDTSCLVNYLFLIRQAKALQHSYTQIEQEVRQRYKTVFEQMLPVVIDEDRSSKKNKLERSMSKKHDCVSLSMLEDLASKLPMVPCFICVCDNSDSKVHIATRLTSTNVFLCDFYSKDSKSIASKNLLRSVVDTQLHIVCPEDCREQSSLRQKQEGSIKLKQNASVVHESENIHIVLGVRPANMDGTKDIIFKVVVGDNHEVTLLDMCFKLNPKKRIALKDPCAKKVQSWKVDVPTYFYFPEKYLSLRKQIEEEKIDFSRVKPSLCKEIRESLLPVEQCEDQYVSYPVNTFLKFLKHEHEVFMAKAVYNFSIERVKGCEEKSDRDKFLDMICDTRQSSYVEYKISDLFSSNWQYSSDTFHKFGMRDKFLSEHHSGDRFSSCRDNSVTLNLLLGFLTGDMSVLECNSKRSPFSVHNMGVFHEKSGGKKSECTKREKVRLSRYSDIVSTVVKFSVDCFKTKKGIVIQELVHEDSRFDSYGKDINGSKDELQYRMHYTLYLNPTTHKVVRMKQEKIECLKENKDIDCVISLEAPHSDQSINLTEKTGLRVDIE